MKFWRVNAHKLTLRTFTHHAIKPGTLEEFLCINDRAQISIVLLLF